MKHIMTFLLITLSITVCLGQSTKTKSILKEIEGQWSLDDHGNVTYVKTIEAPNLSKDEIYSRVQSYFIYNYYSGKNVIQAQDKSLGRVIAKGLYENVHIANSLFPTYFNCWHIIRIDVKEGKARIVLTLTEYEKILSDDDHLDEVRVMRVVQEFPINPEGTVKTTMGKVFHQSHSAALLTLEAIERSVKEGNTSKNIENSDW